MKLKTRLPPAQSALPRGVASAAVPSAAGTVAEEHGNPPLARPWIWFFVASFIVGAALRLSCGGDIEFKFDEWFMFDQSQKAGVTQPIPSLGMESGVGVRNPPMSIWIFLGLRRVFSAGTPPELARSVQILNVLALAALLAFAWRRIDPSLRECWLWAFALVCVDPLAVYLQRKIWAQSTLPIFCVLFLWAWSKRDRAGWALLWGLAGMWLGQIHMSGFIFALVVVIWTAAAEGLGHSARKTAWVAWLAGSGLGLLTMLPWLYYYAQLNHGRSLIAFFLNWFTYPVLHSLFWQLWVSGPLGLGLSCSLGNREFLDYLQYPLLGGNASGLMGLAHAAILVLAGTAFLRFLLRYGREPISWKSALLGKARSDSHLLLAAAFIGYGILLTLNVGLIPRHYLAVTFPLEWVWWMLIFKKAFSTRVMRWALVGLWGCQLILSIGYLGYIHVNHGAKTGDYGVGYQYQNPVFSPEQR